MTAEKLGKGAKGPAKRDPSSLRLEAQILLTKGMIFRKDAKGYRVQIGSNTFLRVDGEINPAQFTKVTVA
jgi:hypothetical protein